MLRNIMTECQKVLLRIEEKMRILKLYGNSQYALENEKVARNNEIAGLKAKNDILKTQLSIYQCLNGKKQIFVPNKTISTTAVIKDCTDNTNKVPNEKSNITMSDKQPEKKVKEKAPKAKCSEERTTNGDNVGINSEAVKLDLRVGKIIECVRHPDADSLYVETVDLGEGKNRTIVSGLVKHIPLEEMQGRKAVFLCNLKAAKMRGILSEGMIMCASTPEKVEILVTPPGVNVGDKIEFEGFEMKPESVLNPKKKIFETVKPFLKVCQQTATCNGARWLVNGAPVKSVTLTDSQIS